MIIPFTGPDSGTGPLTWGQLAIWDAIERTAPDDHYFNFGRVLKVPGERTSPRRPPPSPRSWEPTTPCAPGST